MSIPRKFVRQGGSNLASNSPRSAAVNQPPFSRWWRVMAAGDVAAIERIVRGAQTGLPPVRRPSAFRIRHVLQAAGKVGLDESLAHRRHPPARQEYRRGIRPLANLVLFRRQYLGQERIGRKPVACESDCRGGDLAERHRAVPRQRSDPVGGSGRNNRVQDAVRDAPAVMGAEILGAGCLGPRADAADHHWFFVAGKMNHDWRNAAEADELALQHVDRETGGHACIDRVATGFQHLESGLGSPVMAGRNNMLPCHHVWTPRTIGR